MIEALVGAFSRATMSLLLRRPLVARRAGGSAFVRLSAELIAAIVEIKRRNPNFGFVRIAQQIAHAFSIEIDKDMVRRVLAKHYRPDDSGSHGPSWLTFIAQTKDSLWSLDLFRCESIHLRSPWVMLVMDVFTRRIVGFGVESACIDGV